MAATSFEAHIVFSAKLPFDAEVSLAPGTADALKKLHGMLSTRFNQRLVVRNFPLCSPRARCDPLQLKAEIDKVCLLKYGDRDLQHGESDLLQAAYLVANYITGATMDDLIKSQWLANKQCFSVHKSVLYICRELDINNAELTLLMKDINARHMDWGAEVAKAEVKMSPF